VRPDGSGKRSGVLASLSRRATQNRRACGSTMPARYISTHCITQASHLAVHAGDDVGFGFRSQQQQPSPAPSTIGPEASPGTAGLGLGSEGQGCVRACALPPLLDAGKLQSGRAVERERERRASLLYPPTHTAPLRQCGRVCTPGDTSQCPTTTTTTTTADAATPPTSRCRQIPPPIPRMPQPRQAGIVGAERGPEESPGGEPGSPREIWPAMWVAAPRPSICPHARTHARSPNSRIPAPLRVGGVGRWDANGEQRREHRPRSVAHRPPLPAAIASDRAPSPGPRNLVSPSTAHTAGTPRTPPTPTPTPTQTRARAAGSAVDLGRGRNRMTDGRTDGKPSAMAAGGLGDRSVYIHTSVPAPALWRCRDVWNPWPVWAGIPEEPTDSCDVDAVDRWQIDVGGYVSQIRAYHVARQPASQPWRRLS